MAGAKETEKKWTAAVLILPGKKSQLIPVSVDADWEKAPQKVLAAACSAAKDEPSRKAVESAVSTDFITALFGRLLVLRVPQESEEDRRALRPNPEASKLLHLWNQYGPVLVFGMDMETGESKPLTLEQLAKFRGEALAESRLPPVPPDSWRSSSSVSMYIGPKHGSPLKKNK